MRHETYRSCLARLATANSVNLDLVEDLAGLDERDPDCLTCLAALSRQPASVLLRAVPELRHHQDIDTSSLARDACPTPQTFINDIRPACRGCVAAAGAPPGSVSVWATHDQNVCLRHQLWIGAGIEHPDQQVDLRGHPDIVHAQIRHQRLLRRRGRDATRAAFITADSWWPSLTDQPGYARLRETRIHKAAAQRTSASGEAIGHAVDYPELVAFAAILASPYWQATLNSRTSIDNHRFHTEFQRRVAPDHEEHAYPRLLTWLRRDLERSDDSSDEVDPWPTPTRWQLALADQIQRESNGDRARRTRISEN